jgi:transglutaminase-like putative cysteine protease
VPRIPGPLWGLTKEQRGGITGLSDTMSPGEISDLITSNDVAFRVNFDTEIPAQQKLYWRGPVMVKFNGRTWYQARHERLNEEYKVTTDNPVNYTVTLEPHGKKWIFGLDIPVRTPGFSYMSSEYQLRSIKPVNDLKRYSLVSQLDYQIGRQESFEYLLLAEQLPSNNNLQTIALGQKWASELDSELEIVSQALLMFREQNFVYTLQPPLLGESASDEFLFETRRGFCEHYASSFALLMRAAGIPSRIVTGYQGGELNQVGNYLIVRQSDAHAWTEIWLQDRGWVRIDPTAAVSPDRIEKGLDQALNNQFSGFKISKRNQLLGKFLYNWDNMQHKWNEMILNYDYRKQARFLNQLGLGIRSWGDMVIALVICLVAVFAGYWLIAWYRERPAAPPEYEKIIQLLLAKLAGQGYTREPSEHVFEFLERIQQQGYKDAQLKNIFLAYSKIKYARGYQKEAVIKRLHQMVTSWKVV